METKDVASAAVSDVLMSVGVDRIVLRGWLGKRVDASARARLPQVDTEPLLAGYRKRPGSHPWIGEHVGKWLYAATLTWANDGDPALRAKVARVAAELIACQESDGYLGTYEKGRRFGLYPGADWDVWSHKYNLLGLLMWHRYSGDPASLSCCKKMGDLLIATFGPGKKRITDAGTHVGMAATSVLEPIVLLYRATGEMRFLDFARYIIDDMEAPGGSKVVSTLTATGKVNRTANGKAYEMLSNLVGLCELYRATGDARVLTPAKRAFDDVVENQLYITGSASHHEHFGPDHELPTETPANIGETCVTVTWLHLCEQLLRLTGDAKYGDEIERSLYNHLAAAQRPDGREWCYYTSLGGKKPYGPGINCCVSSGPRGMAIAPRLALFVAERPAPALVVNSLDAFDASASVGGTIVRATLSGAFPASGDARLALAPEKPVRCALRIRAPKWALPMTVAIGNIHITASRPGWLELPARLWKKGDTVLVRYTIGPDVTPGAFGDKGKAAITDGPFVLAVDSGRNPHLPDARRIAFAATPAARAERINAGMSPLVRAKTTAGDAVFAPFADAGADGGAFRVWIGAPGTTPPPPAESREERSRPGNSDGSIIDNDPATHAVTYDGSAAETDWYALVFAKAKTVRAVTFQHGHCYHDGGWFDASSGKPKVEAQFAEKGEWKSLATLETYPATTATDSKGLLDGQSFTAALPEPAAGVYAIRVIGRPACGDNPAQRFTSCAELSVR